jgi:hypothetical protein
MRDYDTYGTHRQMELVQETLRLQETLHQQDSMRKLLILPHFDYARWQRDLAATGVGKHLEDIRTSKVFDTIFDRASADALASKSFELLPFLDQYRTQQTVLRDRLVVVQQNLWWNNPSLLPSFTQASALADSIAGMPLIAQTILESSRLFNEIAMPSLGALVEYRQFFDSAGLLLPRWPRIKRLDERDKKRKFAERLRENRPSVFIRRATSLFYQYQRVLRQIINASMEDEYGEDWAVARLPLCGCKDLVGKWQSAGYGAVLDHADFHHYEKIMSHAEHFERIFGAGFDAPETLITLVRTARKYRNETHHARDTFGPSELFELRVTWNSLKAGLVVLMPDYELGDY